MKIFVCDYLIPSSEEMDSFIIEAESINEAESMAINELKTLNIPKRYIINVEEFLNGENR